MMKLRIRTAVLCAGVALLFSTIYGCAKKGSMADANKAFDTKEYFVALEAYKSVYSTSDDKEEKKEACFRAGECYRLISDNKNAETWYKKALKAGYTQPIGQYRYAESLKNNQKYTDAITELKTYQKLAPADVKGQRMVNGCENALKWKNEKTRYLVENVKELNTKFSDFAANYYKNNYIYFTSDRELGKSKNMYGWTGNQFTDLWLSEVRKGRLQIPTLMEGPINTPFNDGTACFDKKGTVMYFTQCNGKDGKGKTCKIFMTTNKGKEWEEPVVLPFCSDSFNCGHPALSADGNILYFSSDMPGGQGSKDIYMSNWVRKSRTWGDPINLGPTINTEGEDMYPFVHTDGTLYYASNGLVGLGGLDIFWTKGQGTEWQEPVNMKSPINSGGDDFAFICDEKKETGYLTSNREGGKGQDDIWKFSMAPLKFTISGVARDSKTKQILPGTLIVMTNSRDTVKRVVKTDPNGFYKFTLDAETDYELNATKEDYYDAPTGNETTKKLEQSTDLVHDFELTPFDYSALIKVEGIYYDLDQAFLRPRSREVLDSLVLTLNRYPRIMIELGSHTDCRSDSVYNIRLSQARADSAVNYLIANGIDPERLIARGYGENVLTNDCACEGSFIKKQCTEEEHQANRRTTVKILSNKFIPRTRSEMKDLKQQETKPPVKAPGDKGAPPPAPKK